SQSLPACNNMSLTVSPVDPTSSSLGTPPYYMLAFPTEKNGIPTRSPLGSDAGNLHWVVDQPIDAELFLNVIDANGGTGGLPTQTDSFLAGQSTGQCLPPVSNTVFTLTSNVTGNVLNTCQPWGLAIDGGVPPYNITIAALGSQVVTNVTISLKDNFYTYINRVEPGAQLIGTPTTGRWAAGVPLVRTQGNMRIL
ncbi:hypothetical protein BD779DRAFT_1439687, partial [Infundibulicybe gibba]